MSELVWFLGGAIAALVGVLIGLSIAHARSRTARRRLEAELAEHELERSFTAPVPVVGPHARAEPEPNHLITPPPMVGDRTLRDWLVHHHPTRDQVWPNVVAEFYRRASAVPEIADYFRNTEMERQKRHFTYAIKAVTGDGVDAANLRRLREIHLNRAHNSAGQPITLDIWNAVIATLAAVLSDAMGKDVPERIRHDVLDQLGRTIAPIREVLVRA